MCQLLLRPVWLGRLAVVTLIVLMASANALGGEAFRTCNPSCSLWKFWSGASASYFFNGNVPAAWQNAFNAAANEWTYTLGGYGAGLMLNGGDTVLEVVVETPTLGSQYVAEWDPGAGKIRINPDFVGISNNEKLATAFHEFGHQLGFQDSSCYSAIGTVMGPVGPNSPTSLTENDFCGLNYYYDPACEAGGGEDYYSHCTPLVLSFSSRLPSFSSPNVPFDIAANGALPLCAWLDRRVDGLLVLDRNKDGTINNGTELFGNVTPRSAGVEGPRSWSGFAALAFFDSRENGGNGNQLIDPADTVFGDLRVWFDHDRDGFSHSAELVSLAALGVEYIQLNALSLNVLDSQGNLLWFRSSFAYRLNDRIRREGSVTDVIFKVK